MSKTSPIHTLLRRSCQVLLAPALAMAAVAPATAATGEPATSHAGVKHGGSGIAMHADVPAQLPAGQATPVELRFEGVGAAGATASLRVPDGVRATRVDGGSLASIPLQPGRATRVQLLVTPASDGLRRLAVFTEQDGRRSAHTVRLSSGDTQQAKPASRAVTTPSGEKIVPMKSQPR